MYKKMKAQSKSVLEIGIDDTEAEALINASIEKKLIPRDKEKLTVFILFDSRVATHNESIEKVHSDAFVSWLV